MYLLWPFIFELVMHIRTQDQLYSISKKYAKMMLLIHFLKLQLTTKLVYNYFTAACRVYIECKILEIPPVLFPRGSLFVNRQYTVMEYFS